MKSLPLYIFLIGISLGTCTGEHGVGQGKMLLLEEQFGKDEIDVMRQIKSALNPRQIMNPGKAFSRD
jgi:D-lactate dehydrogenase (cytochrome)